MDFKDQNYYFSVIASHKIRSGEPFTVTGVRFSEYGQKYHDIVAQIVGKTSGGENYESDNKTICLYREYITSVMFDTSNIPPGDYSLLVTTSDGFKQIKSLTYMSKHLTFIIQLNKGIFKPGDLVQFRVFSMDSETRAKNPDLPVYISISDSNGNLIASYYNVGSEFMNGIFQAEARLDDSVALGSWTIRVEMNDEITEKQFEVIENPLFSASLSMPSSLPLSYKKIPITIEIINNIGQAFDGYAILDIEKSGEIILTKNISLLSKSLTIDFDMVDDLKADNFDNFGRKIYYNINLTVVENLTQKSSSDKRSFTIREFTNELFITGDPYLIQGEPFNFLITLKKFDETPTEAGIELEVNVAELEESFTLKVDVNGQIASFLEIPETVDFVNFIVTAKDSYNANLYVETVRSDLRLDVITDSPQLYKEVQILATTKTKVDSIVVLIASKGVLLESRIVEFPTNSIDEIYSAMFSFEPTFEYLPTPFILAFYIDDEGKFVTKSIRVLMEEKLPNSILFSFQNREVQPGGKLKFSVFSAPNSTIALKAVSKRDFLSTNSDNYKSAIFADLQLYNSIKWYLDEGVFKDFTNSRLIIITNVPSNDLPFEENFPSTSTSPKFLPKTAANKFQTDFAETFLWQNILTDSTSGSADVEITVPESLTSYVITGVSMNSKIGFGVPESNSVVEIFRSFFIAFEFPFSMRKEELLLQDIFIFDYLGEPESITVTVKKDQFEAPGYAEYGWTESETSYTQIIPTTKDIFKYKVQFPIKALTSGFTNLKISAVSSQAGASIEKPLRVLYEGVQRIVTKSVVLALYKPAQNVIKSLEISLPKDAIKETIEIYATVSGQLSVKPLYNLETLMAYNLGEDGEDILLNYFTSLTVGEFVKATEGQLSYYYRNRLIPNLQQGYKNALKFLKNDGSLSVFGEDSESGSTWLSAYALKAFYFTARLYEDISIDHHVITNLVSFIVKQQNENGGFWEAEQPTGVNVALTAFVSAVLTEISSSYSLFESNRDLANDFLSTIETFDVYELALISYALTLANHEKAFEFYDKLINMQIETEEGSFWKRNVSSSIINSKDIETNSYGLLTTLLNDDISSAVKIVQFLFNQSNQKGGFVSSRDTGIAFYALSEFYKKFTTVKEIELVLKPNIGDEISANVNSNNYFVTQEFDLNSNVRSLAIFASTLTSGIAKVSLTAKFYQNTANENSTFLITYNVKFSCFSRISFEVCASNLLGTSNAAIMVVTMPSGFKYFTELSQSNPNIIDIATTALGTQVAFKFYSIGNEESCVDVLAYQVNFVNGTRTGTIEVWEMYDSDTYSSLIYDAPRSDFC